MPYKNVKERTRIKREWKHYRKHALELLKSRHLDAGKPAKEWNPTALSGTPELKAAMAEVKELVRQGALPPPGGTKTPKPLAARPPKLPVDELTVRLEDPRQLPDGLVKYGHTLLMTFLEELPVLGDVQITALKNGLPVDVLNRYVLEGSVDHRENRHTWNAALWRRVAQGRAHAMAFGVANLRGKITSRDKENPVDHRTQLRATEIYLRMVFPERFLPGRNQVDVVFPQVYGGGAAPPGPVPNADPTSPVGAPALVAATEDELDDMASIPLSELQVTLQMLRGGELG